MDQKLDHSKLNDIAQNIRILTNDPDIINKLDILEHYRLYCIPEYDLPSMRIHFDIYMPVIIELIRKRIPSLKEAITEYSEVYRVWLDALIEKRRNISLSDPERDKMIGDLVEAKGRMNSR